MWSTNKRKSEAPMVLLPRNKPVKYCCVTLGMSLCLSVPPIHCLLSGIIMTWLHKDKDAVKTEFVHVLCLT